MAGSGDGERPAAGSGDGGRALLHPPDYPCTKRLRLRRPFAYLRWHSYTDVYEAEDEEMHAVFHVQDLVKQVKAGQLRPVFYYVLRFIPTSQSSYEAKLLALFLRDLIAMNYFADGQSTVAGLVCGWFISSFRHPVLDKYPCCFATLVADVLFLRSDHAIYCFS